MQIEIKNAVITAEDGTVTNATITGDATIAVDPNAPRPTHPILLPPETPPGTDPDSFWMLCFCSNPPPPHWEWIAFTPGDDVPPRPHPVPPEPPTEPPTSPGGEKPFPPDGGWGYKEPYGWIYWPGSKGPGPKRGK